jgi:enoyl-CoA hydratase/carnithine racemase
MSRSFLDDSLSWHRQGPLCLLIFHSTRTRNALNPLMAKILYEFLESLSQESDLGALVLLSEVPDVFVSGGDLRVLADASAEEANALTLHMRSFCQGLQHSPFPTYALLEGGAFGGGSEVALATDVRIGVAGKAALHLRQVQFGLPGGWGGMLRLGELCPHLTPRQVGLWFATKKSLNSLEMKSMHLLEEDFQSQSHALAHIQNQAEAFLQCPPSLRQSLLRRASRAEKTLQTYDEELFALHWMSPTHKEKLAAFFSRKQNP